MGETDTYFRQFPFEETMGGRLRSRWCPQLDCCGTVLGR